MKQKKYKIIGVMSGTSLDGIDISVIEFSLNEKWTFKIKESKTYKYADFWFEKLKNLTAFNKTELVELDKDYTMYLAEVIINFKSEFNTKNIDAVCSHGHTALHKPDEGLTYQIGNLKLLAELVKEKVVCDFRVQDVDYGGQGAPLVPIGDKLLFSQFDACINLGGFSNISKDIENQRIAYDISPANIVLNHYVSKLGKAYDSSGEISASGDINQLLLSELNCLDFYKTSFPKSLGLEWVIDVFFPIIDKYELEIKDILRTCVEHFAIQITSNFLDNEHVLFTGGGVYNTFLMDRIKALTNAEIIIPDTKLIEFKEALIFGFLGVLRLRNDINCLASVTGASKDHSSGVIH